MNKIATYLNEHVLGEVSSLKAVRRRYSQDGSILSIVPELVVFAKVTNDIRKVARFTWQLAEKGHAIGMTVRGNGTDTTGAAIGKGIIINTSAHLNNILRVAPKERLVHVQAGANVRAVNDSLIWNGLTVLSYPTSADYSTIGGAVANNASGESGTIGDAVERLEVVLANGDVIEVGKVSKREVGQKQGLQTLEGEIYRKLEGIIEDNPEVIRSLENSRDHAGYASIAQVKAKDGSMNLTPLFIGSQGTLGIISEIVLRAEFNFTSQSILIATLPGKELARDVIDHIRQLDPAALEMIDGELYVKAIEKGKKYTALGTNSVTHEGAVLYVAFNQSNDRAQGHKLKKLKKILTKQNIHFLTNEQVALEELAALRDVSSVVSLNVTDTEALPPVIDGAYIPADRHEEFGKLLAELASKLHIALPTRTNVLTGTVSVYPTLKLGELGDKQKVFRLMSEYSALVTKTGGAFIGEDGEGRLKANAAWAQLDDDVKHVYEQVRAAFDPLGTLNPGVKQPGDVRRLAESLRSSHDTADLLDRGMSR